MPKYLVVSTSGNTTSNSRTMGRVAFRYLTEAQVDCAWLDLNKLNLPLCDADACSGEPGAQQLRRAIQEADGILVPAPGPNYDGSPAPNHRSQLDRRAWAKGPVRPNRWTQSSAT